MDGPEAIVLKKGRKKMSGFELNAKQQLSPLIVQPE